MTQCHDIVTVVRTQVFEVVTSSEFMDSLTQCRHAQRAAFNMTVASLAPQGGPVPASQRSPDEPDGTLGQLTVWRGQKDNEWLKEIPVLLLRPAVVEATGALRAHETAMRERTTRLADEDKAWAKWMEKNPHWDSGAWDAMAPEQRKALIKKREAPPKLKSTYGDERHGDGCRKEMFKTRKRNGRCAVSWHTAPQRVDANTVRLPGLGDCVVKTNKGLPEASRLKAARVCVRRQRSGTYRVWLHLSVAIDANRKPKRRSVDTVKACGIDVNTTDILALDNGEMTRFDPHDTLADAYLATQREMEKLENGSRTWRVRRDRLRQLATKMKNQDLDVIMKRARQLAIRFDLITAEDNKPKAMSAKARPSGVGACAKTKLNAKIRAAQWGRALSQVESAAQSEGGVFLKVPAPWSSQTCAQCGHRERGNRRKKVFRCLGCEHEADANTNAGRIIRARGLWCWRLMREGATKEHSINALWILLRKGYEVPTELASIRGRKTNPRGTHGSRHGSTTGLGGAKATGSGGQPRSATGMAIHDGTASAVPIGGTAARHEGVSGSI